MTLSDFSLPRLADNIKFLHSLGFKDISGVNLAEGSFDWNDDKYIKILIPQLQKLVEFYINNETLKLNQMFAKQICACETNNRERRKWCGIGIGCPFFDVDGTMYPCSFITPMTFTENELSNIIETDYEDEEIFLDEYCFDNCYIYPICSTCYGANYLNNKSFKQRDKTRCKIQRLIALFVADLSAKRIVKNSKLYGDDNNTLYHTIEAIKNIRTLYLPEFQEFLT